MLDNDINLFYLLIYSCNYLSSIFDELNELAHDPMQAALAFQSIVAAVKQAEAAAGDAVRLAEDIVKLV